MSLITRCPACGTLFKVVADQLKISQGWVRCGQCSEVFDAQAQMAGATSGPSAQVPLQAEHPSVAPEAIGTTAPTVEHATGTTNRTAAGDATALPQANQATGAVAFQIHMLDDEADSDNDPVSVSSVPSALYADFSDSNWINTVNPPAPQSRADMADSAWPSLLSSHPSAGALAAAGAGPLESKLQPATRPSLLPAGMGSASGGITDHTANPVEEPPSFVRQAQRAQRWRSPWMRVLLLLVSVALLAALGAQIALQERDRIAALEPRARPWIKELCAVAGCTVGSLKQIEAVVVDASSFNKLRTEGKYELYKLALNLKNTGALSVAVPHIELSLNDAQDQPVLRRVLSPADLGSALSVLAPAAELAGNTTIQVDSTQLAGARVAGYRVWAFYP
jgi:predicted Zn finger-like uncharacterized protein